MQIIDNVARDVRVWWQTSNHPLAAVFKIDCTGASQAFGSPIKSKLHTHSKNCSHIQVLVLNIYGSGSQTFSIGGSLAKSRFSQGSQCQILRSALCEKAAANDFICRDR